MSLKNKPQEESQTKRYSILFFLPFFIEGGCKKRWMLMEKFLPVYVFCLHRPQLSQYKPNLKHFDSSLKINGIMPVSSEQKGLSEISLAVDFGELWNRLVPGPLPSCPTS